MSTVERVVDHAAIRDLLPQRYPMLLVDRVVQVRADGLTSVKAVSATEPCYRAIPAAAPTESWAYPEALLVESFGQSAALAWLLVGPADQRERLTGGNLLPLFAGLRDVSFEGAAYPGDVLRNEVRLEHVSDGAAFASGEVLVGDRVIARFGSLIAVTRPGAELAG
ncbi:3-hydroxyacyl-ACP dehydratase FabZ family protein [Actinokineospora enzanensis]|uniref:3-hydroxyacyl-ACP dehydratase FabZ family protein n=1 Tax=Actinokineospora enzanensis TaxID=155975 RepID=UPI00037B1338|nr:hypothetical protein [Actinokineospora enzanensis]